jgi:hypothetical protein
MGASRLDLALLAYGGPDVLTDFAQKREALRQTYEQMLTSGVPQFDISSELARRYQDISAQDQLLRDKIDLVRTQAQNDAAQTELKRLGIMSDMLGTDVQMAKLEAAKRYAPVAVNDDAKQEANILNLGALQDTKDRVAGLRDTNPWDNQDVGDIPGFSEQLNALQEERDRVAGDTTLSDTEREQQLRDLDSRMAWTRADALLAKQGGLEWARNLGIQANSADEWLRKVAEAASQKNDMEILAQLLRNKTVEEGTVPFTESGEVAPWAANLLRQRAAERRGMDPLVAREKYPFDEPSAREEYEQKLFEAAKQEESKRQFLSKQEQEAEAEQFKSFLDQMSQGDNRAASVLSAIQPDDFVKAAQDSGITPDDLKTLAPLLEASANKAADIMASTPDLMNTGWTEFQTEIQKALQAELKDKNKRSDAVRLWALISRVFAPVFRQTGYASSDVQLAQVLGGG